MTAQIPLEEYSVHGATAVWRTASPFVENSRGVLIHRPRSVNQYKLGGSGSRWAAHIGVHYWCGNGTTGGKNIVFLDAPPKDKLLCAICEARATLAGRPSAFAIVGRHVHVGRVVALQTCCQHHESPVSENLPVTLQEQPFQPRGEHE